jgi:hypothetical protein
MSRTEAEFQIAVSTKPYAKMSRKSNQQKSEFVKSNFGIQRFWGGNGEISSKS